MRRYLLTLSCFALAGIVGLGLLSATFGVGVGTKHTVCRIPHVLGSGWPPDGLRFWPHKAIRAKALKL